MLTLWHNSLYVLKHIFNYRFSSCILSENGFQLMCRRKNRQIQKCELKSPHFMTFSESFFDYCFLKPDSHAITQPLLEGTEQSDLDVLRSIKMEAEFASIIV